MATLTNAKVYNMGSSNLYSFYFSGGVTDGDTYNTGLGTRIHDQRWWYQCQADPSVNSGAAIALTNSSGTFTFYPAKDSLAGTLFVVADGISG